MKKSPLLILVTLFLLCSIAEGIVVTKEDTNTLLLLRGKYIKSYLKKHPETPEEIKNKMLSGRVDVGMDKEQTEALVGKPSEIKADPTDKTKETYVYSGTNKYGMKMAPDVFYYFEDGLLVGYENEQYIKIREYIASHQDRPAEILQTLKQGKVAIGMAKEEVELVFGKPSDVNRTVTANNISEQWIYSFAYRVQKYLYFDNGVLTSWQE